MAALMFCNGSISKACWFKYSRDGDISGTSATCTNASGSWVSSEWKSAKHLLEGPMVL